MKKTLTAIALLAGAVSGYSQGQVQFYGYGGSAGASDVLHQQIFNLQLSAPAGATPVSVSYGGYTVSEYQGSTALSSENPQGGAAYASGTALSGTGFDAQLYIGSGAGLSISALSPVGSVANFFTSAAALGYIKGTQSITLGSAPAVATEAIAAWQSTGSKGAAASLAAAQADGYNWGFSNPATVSPTVSPAGPAGMATSIESFSLGTVPEPSTIALGVMGASTLLFRRRK